MWPFKKTPPDPSAAGKGAQKFLAKRVEFEELAESIAREMPEFQSACRKCRRQGRGWAEYKYARACRAYYYAMSRSLVLWVPELLVTCTRCGYTQGVKPADGEMPWVEED